MRGGNRLGVTYLDFLISREDLSHEFVVVSIHIISIIYRLHCNIWTILLDTQRC